MNFQRIYRMIRRSATLNDLSAEESSDDDAEPSIGEQRQNGGSPVDDLLALVTENHDPEDVQVLCLHNAMGIDRRLLSFTAIRRLELSHGYLTEIGDLRELVSLTHLDLSGCQVHILTGLEQLVQLQALVLDRCPITRLPKDVVRPLKELRNLSLISTLLTNIFDLAEALQLLPALVDLWLEGTPIRSRKSVDLSLYVKYYSVSRPLRVQQVYRHYPNPPYQTPICEYYYYSSFLVCQLSLLTSLNGITITTQFRNEAKQIYKANFEPFPYNVRTRPLAAETVRNREIHSVRVGEHRRQLESGTVLRNITLRTSCAKGDVRQFEYNHNIPGQIAVGTTTGRVGLVSQFDTSPTVKNSLIHCESGNSVLALAWTNTVPMFFLAGSDDGSVSLYDFGSETPKLLNAFDKSERLTSVSLNSIDETFLTSGFTSAVRFYNLRTGVLTNTLNDMHSLHINVSKFSYHNPNLFVTSSFDCRVKLWDLRSPLSTPVSQWQSNRGVVMACWRPDDVAILSSAENNEVYQVDVRNATKPMLLRQRTTLKSGNYTRSYYMNHGKYILSGSSNEQAVYLYNSSTGKLLREVTLHSVASPRRALREMTRDYVQSLRGDPFHNWCASILFMSNAGVPSSEIIHVDFAED